ncbi:MAG: thioredoxin family protein [Myxococcales bacterium]|nr:thioredoxin family protein [Myxococcales bacterium]
MNIMIVEKHLILSVLVVLLLTLTSFVTHSSADEDKPAALTIGASAPLRTEKMKAAVGDAVSLDDIKGSVGSLVVFTCNHCPWAQAWEGRIAEIAREFKDKGIHTIAVNPNDPAKYADDRLEKMAERAKAADFQFPYVVDEGSKLAKAFGASRTPEIFLFDKDWKLVYYGAVDDNANKPTDVRKSYLRDAMLALVGGKTIDPATTKALGCGIKFY